jgi:hypothetical protein
MAWLFSKKKTDNSFNVDRLIYINREYADSIYEEETGKSAKTTIAKNSTIKGDAKATLFSIGALASETSTYPLSNFEIIKKIKSRLSKIEQKNDVFINAVEISKTIWVEGILTTATEISSSSNIEKCKNFYFQIELESGDHIILILNEKYFMYDFSVLLSPNSYVTQVSLPIKALIRVFSMKNAFNNLIAVPLILTEKET